MDKEWIINIRFTVKAKEDWLASNKWFDWIPEVNDDIVEYLIIDDVKEKAK